jgi:hypothetical protein
MRRSLISIAVLILALSIAAALGASAPIASNAEAEALRAQKVRLTGRAASWYMPCIDCGFGWWVDVPETIAGPAVTRSVLVFLDVTIAGPCRPAGHMDHGIGPGDTVEAYGEIRWGPWLPGDYVSLCGSESYYLRRVRPLQHRVFLPLVTKKS